MKPFHFPSLTPEEIEGKKVVYLLFCFPPPEVINKRLEKGIYDIGHVCAIRDTSAFLRGWRTDNFEVFVIVVEALLELRNFEINIFKKVVINLQQRR